MQENKMNTWKISLSDESLIFLEEKENPFYLW